MSNDALKKINHIAPTLQASMILLVVAHTNYSSTLNPKELTPI